MAEWVGTVDPSTLAVRVSPVREASDDTPSDPFLHIGSLGGSCG